MEIKTLLLTFSLSQSVPTHTCNCSSPALVFWKIIYVIRYSLAFVVLNVETILWIFTVMNIQYTVFKLMTL